MSKHRVVVVTGGGSGMGRAIAHKFAQDKDTVYILGRREEKLRETAKGFDTIHCISVDLTNPASVLATRDQIVKENPHIDVLVNNAGGNIKIDPDSTIEQAAEGWQQIIDKNLTSIFYMVNAFLGSIKKPGGRVINISSTAALAGSTAGGYNGQAYSAAKSGIHGLTRTLVHALSKDGITINCVSPGVIDDTEFFGASKVPEDRKKVYLERIPMHRLGEPKDIAAAVYYLASAEASFITGEILNVNGGMVFGR